MHSADSDDSSSLAQVASCKIDVIRHLTVVRLVSLPNSSNMVAERHGSRERISERTAEQIADAHVPQVVKRMIEVPKMAEQILDVPVPEMVEQKLPETVSEDRIQQRNVEQIVDGPVPQDVEELVEVFKVSPQDMVKQRFVEQIIETPAFSIAEKGVEILVIQTHEKMRLVANTHVQHVVNTVEAAVPLSHFIDKAVEILFGAQRQISMVQTLQTSIKIPQLQITDKVIDVPVVQAERVPQVAQSEVVEAIEIEIKTVDLEWVQVHPAGLVKPDDPNAQIKFLAAEALHGVHGNRLTNELGRREYVTEEMWKNQPLFRLALNKAASDDIAWQCKHYAGRGVTKLHESGTALAEGMG